MDYEELIEKIERIVQPISWNPGRAKASEKKVFHSATAKAVYELIQEYKNSHE